MNQPTLLQRAEDMAAALEEQACLAVLNMSGATPEELVEYAGAQLIRQLAEEIKRLQKRNELGSWAQYEAEQLRRIKFDEDSLNNPMGQ